MCSIKTKEQIYIYIFYNNLTIFFLTSLLRIFIFININYLSLKIYHHAQKSFILAYNLKKKFITQIFFFHFQKVKYKSGVD